MTREQAKSRGLTPWQPKDGEVYRFLVNLLEDDLYAPLPVERLEYAPMLAAAF